METKEITSPSIGKLDYASICVYLKHIESIQITQLYRALKSYLSCLILANSTDYLSVYETHLQYSFSWLKKAQLFSEVDSKKDLIQSYFALASEQDKPLWADLEKKINYLMNLWDQQDLLSCQQIIQGIVTLVEEKIPLADVQAEIIQFAEARQVFPLADMDIAKRLEHLYYDAWVNSSTFLSKMSKTVRIQADLFLNRLKQTNVSEKDFDSKQAFLFESNYQLSSFIENQAASLREVFASFPDRLSKKLSLKIANLSMSSILQRYKEEFPSLFEGFTEHSMQKSMDSFEQEMNIAMNNKLAEENASFSKDSFSDLDLDLEDEFSFDSLELEKNASFSSSMVEELNLTSNQIVNAAESHFYSDWEKILIESEQLLEKSLEQIALYRLQLSCFSRIKACYAKFTLFPVFEKIGHHLMHHQSSLKNSLSVLSAQVQTAHFPDEKKHHFDAMIKGIENGLDRIKTYLQTVENHNADHMFEKEVARWQFQLHKLIFKASEDELLQVERHLQHIEMMHSPYLRATLVMKLHIIKKKLNDMIIGNMQSWSSKLVDKKTVVNTLNYLGIQLDPVYLDKIAPYLCLNKEMQDSKKRFFAALAHYGMAAWRFLKSWLNEQAIRE